LESAAQGIVVANIHGRITLINTVCEKMFGYNRDELLDQPMEILLPEPLRQRHQKHRAEFFSKPESRVMGNGLELVGLRKDGTTFPIEVGLSSIDIYEGTFVMASINDITQRKELEKKLRQIDKLEAIGQLAGGIAHDFNNVLANIIGMGELALRKMERSESPEEFIRMIIDKAYDAANLVRQLLTFSRKQSISLRPINFQSVLEHNIKLLHRYLGEEVEIKTHIEPNLYLIEADESAVGQIVTNLCINARDAMPDGGEIQLTAENIQLDTTLLSDMGEIPNGEYVKLTVIDHGVGMTRDIKKRIFDPFYTTKDIGEGTGLGLSIVYALVKQLNGWMNCKSRLGVGTTFEIFFPGLDPEAQTEQTKKSKINAKGNETILLVENEADLITSYKSSLETYGYKVLVASNGLQALNIFEQKASSIDLIVSDVVMPKMGGVELRIHAKRVNPDIKFLFISAYPDKLEPGNYILQKPFRSKELISKVREIIDK
ncbi:MAG: PAS domain S-box protein, partial [Calditrichaceae bacterium]